MTWVSKLHRWHWVVIALLVGFGGGALRQNAYDFEDELDTYGTLIPSQRRFEEAIVTEVQGQRMFKNLVVYPYHLRDGHGDRLVHIVTGWYWNGRPEVINGQPQARYTRGCYLAASPYRPLDPTDGAWTGQTVAVGPSFTVLDYLKSLHASAGVQYRYAWWWWAVRPLSLWALGSVLLIGVLWPTFINLWTFGTFSRPRGEQSSQGLPWRSLLALRRVEPRPTAAVPAPAGHISLEASLDAIEQELAAGAASPVDSPEVPAASAAKPAVLNTAPLEPAPAAAKADDKDFGTESDDYYPTELHAGHHEEERPGSPGGKSLR